MVSARVVAAQCVSPLPRFLVLSVLSSSAFPGMLHYASMFFPSNLSEISCDLLSLEVKGPSVRATPCFLRREKLSSVLPRLL